MYKITATVSSPENKGLNNTNEISTRLEKKDAEILHYIVPKLIWIAKGGRSKVELDILFLCNIVTKSINKEKAKLRQLMQ